MSRRVFLAILAAGAPGYVVFALLFPRYSDGAQWRIGLGRDDAVVRARAVLDEYGVDVTGWRTEAGVRADPLNRTIAEQGSVTSAGAQVVVSFHDPRNDERAAGVRFASDGEPTAIVIRRPSSPDDATSVAAARPIAERAMRRLLPRLDDYRLTAQEDLAERGVRFGWELPDPRDAAIVHRATAVVRGSELTELRYGAESSAPAASRPPVRPSKAIDIATDIFVVVSVLFGTALFVIGAVRRTIPPRLAVFLPLVFAALLMIDLAGEPDPATEALLFDRAPPARAVMLIGLLFITLPAGLAVAAGYPFAARRFPRQIATYDELLVRWRIGSRRVAAAVLAGIAAGGWIASIPYLVRATNLFGRYHVREAHAEPLFRSAVIPPPIFGALIPVLLAFALLVPFVQDKLRGRAGAVVAFVVAFVVFVDPEDPLLPALIASVLVTAAYDQLFRRVGLLPAAAAAVAGAFALGTASRLVQPAEAIHTGGLIAAAAGGTIALLVAFVAMRGSERAYEPWRPPPARAERERIRAEMEVARRAQERMLPSVPPTFAASLGTFFRPARHVGGDLYEFVTMADGSLGIAVADVSGKGLPAALVMTITKGLLLAASDGRSSPLQICADVNDGIHSLGNRSVFVTMIFGVLTPTSFRFVRAGHTALLCRRASGAVEVLAPRGLGLGMTSARYFSALTEEVTLAVAAGDFLVLYSDGVTEAMNADSEEFGEERLIAALEKKVESTMAAEQVRGILVDEIEQFRGNAPLHDDVTIVVVRC